MQFPSPIKLSAGSTRWPLSALEAYEAACKGQSAPHPRNTAEERYLSVKQVAARYGASVPTVWRWCRLSITGEETA